MRVLKSCWNRLGKGQRRASQAKANQAGGPAAAKPRRETVQRCSVVGVEAGAAGLARWPRQQARVIQANRVWGPLTQFAGKLIWAPWAQLKGCGR